MTRSTWALLFAIVLVGAFVRLRVNDVTTYSRADETVYLLYAKRLASEGVGAYPEIVRKYLASQDDWKYPAPLRFGYLGTIGVACKAATDCTHRNLAWVSTMAGILALVATFLLARELLSVPVALAATALSVMSPLQLALGRRALSDEVSCAAGLFALWALVRAARAPPSVVVTRYATSVVLSALLFAVKETAVLMAPAALAAVFVLRGGRFERRDILLFFVPLLLAYSAFSIVSHSATAWVQILRAEQAGTVGASYVEQYNSGPPHRILADLFLLAPLACLYGAAALALTAFSWRDLPAGTKSLVVMLTLTLVAVSLLAVKNVRYAINVDGLVRVLGAWLLVVRVAPSGPFGRHIALALGGACAVSDYLVFDRVFLAGAVYDPVTAELVRALRMTP